MQGEDYNHSGKWNRIFPWLHTTLISPEIYSKVEMKQKAGDFVLIFLIFYLRPRNQRTRLDGRAWIKFGKNFLGTGVFTLITFFIPQDVEDTQDYGDLGREFGKFYDFRWNLGYKYFRYFRWNFYSGTQQWFTKIYFQNN